MRSSPPAFGALAGLAVLVASAGAAAAPPWVDRRMTPLSGQWNFDVGVGVDHTPDDNGTVSSGMNLEMAVGLTDRVELGVRTGIRFGDATNVSGIKPDRYGRLFDRQYFDGGDGVVANPELRVRWAFLSGSVGEVGLEGRFIAPLENNTYAGLSPGLPVALHLGERVRLDTGVFMPIVTNPQATTVGLSVPLDIWIQVTPRLWLGPMTGLQNTAINRNQSTTSMSMGFGLGYQITRYLDFKTMLLLPELSNDSRYFGVGAGVQIRIE
jgi:hypothetical protein